MLRIIAVVVLVGVMAFVIASIGYRLGHPPHRDTGPDMRAPVVTVSYDC